MVFLWLYISWLILKFQLNKFVCLSVAMCICEISADDLFIQVLSSFCYELSVIALCLPFLQRHLFLFSSKSLMEWMIVPCCSCVYLCCLVQQQVLTAIELLAKFDYESLKRWSKTLNRLNQEWNHISGILKWQKWMKDKIYIYEGSLNRMASKLNWVMIWKCVEGLRQKLKPL